MKHNFFRQSIMTNAFAYYRNTLGYTALRAGNASVSGTAAALRDYTVRPASDACIERRLRHMPLNEGCVQ